jgi:hypothetical protein
LLTSHRHCSPDRVDWPAFVLWLGANVRSGAPAILGEIAALVALVVGVAVLSRRAPHVVAQSAKGDRQRRAATAKGALAIHRRTAHSLSTEQAR